MDASHKGVLRTQFSVVNGTSIMPFTNCELILETMHELDDEVYPTKLGHYVIFSTGHNFV